MNALKMLEHLSEAIEEMEDNLRAAQDENKDMQFLIDEKELEIHALESEIRILCSFLYNIGVPIPRSGHSTDINALVPKDDPYQGHYEYEDAW